MPTMPRVIARLFVYGTLGPGRPNAHILHDVPGSWEPATVRGRLVEHGWGAELGFPALVLDPGGPDVPGDLFTSEAFDWDELDAFEGPGYERVITRARRSGLEPVDACIYVARAASPEG